MSDKTPKPQKHEFNGTKIKVYLSADEWLEFETDKWMFGEYVKFTQGVATDYMPILLNRISAWRLKDDLSGAYIDFNREFLLEHMESLNVSAVKQREMITAYYRAWNLAATLDLEKK